MTESNASVVTPGEATPPVYRSLYYVSTRLSADGNDYRPGDPIPWAEAVRQGVVSVEERPEAPARMRCPRCDGHGFYAWPKPKGHRSNCGCKFCQKCPVCEGHGHVDAAPTGG